MTTPTAAPIGQEEIELYGNVLSEIKFRAEMAEKKLRDVTEIVELESAALQLRKSIELVALGTLAANRQVVHQVSTALHKKDWDDARKILRNINPNYWPTPFTAKIGPDGKRALEAFVGPFLSEKEAPTAYGFLSNLLHANNPFAKPSAIDQKDVDRVRDISLKLRNLLGLHTAELGNREHVVVASMDTPRDGRVLVQLWNEVSRETRTVDSWQSTQLRMDESK